jgi:hypothetical protein
MRARRNRQRGESRCPRLTNPVTRHHLRGHAACISSRTSDKRTSAWLKLKKDYVVGLSDSLDLIPVGAWHGNGRKVTHCLSAHRCIAALMLPAGTVVESSSISCVGQDTWQACRPVQMHVRCVR